MTTFDMVEKGDVSRVWSSLPTGLVAAEARLCLAARRGEGFMNGNSRQAGRLSGDPVVARLW